MTLIKSWTIVAILSLGSFAKASAQNAVPLMNADVSELPLIELPTRTPAGSTFAILLTGDGGFAALDKGVSAALVAHGMPVVVLNTRPYLERRRTPDSTGSDLIRIMRHYLLVWNMKQVAIVGYSRGADIAPFMVSRLPADLRARVALVAMMGLARRVNFQWHFKDIFVDSKRPSDVPTVPEIEKLKGLNLLCIYGEDEKDSACRDLSPGLAKQQARSGGHHFDNDYNALGAEVIGALSGQSPFPAR
jgi:type IV secretory pathway VirJ component